MLVNNLALLKLNAFIVDFDLALINHIYPSVFFKVSIFSVYEIDSIFFNV